MARRCLRPPPPARDTMPCEPPPESGDWSVIPPAVAEAMRAEWAEMEADPPPVGVRDLDAATRGTHGAMWPGSLYR